MKIRPVLTLVLLAALANCGVPRETRSLAAARRYAADSLSDDDVRAALRQQPDAWSLLAAQLRQQQLFGIPNVSPAFAQSVDAARAAAQRQVVLMDTHQDDPAKNRQLLAAFENLWRTTETYLAR